jgi:hypothetical protein
MPIVHVTYIQPIPCIKLSWHQSILSLVFFKPVVAKEDITCWDYIPHYSGDTYTIALVGKGS